MSDGTGAGAGAGATTPTCHAVNPIPYKGKPPFEEAETRHVLFIFSTEEGG